jgi:hypothetical protein
MPEFYEPCFLAELENLKKEFLEGLEVAPPEGSNDRKVRHVAGGSVNF